MRGYFFAMSAVSPRLNWAILRFASCMVCHFVFHLLCFVVLCATMGRFVVDAIPYYNLFKGLVLVYCFHPYTKVSATAHRYRYNLGPSLVCCLARQQQPHCSETPHYPGLIRYSVHRTRSRRAIFTALNWGPALKSSMTVQHSRLPGAAVQQCLCAGVSSPPGYSSTTENAVLPWIPLVKSA